MTTQYLLVDLKSDEGCKLHAYPDPLTGGAPWTVGYGATGNDIRPRTVWSQAQADDDIVSRVGQIESRLNQAIPWWRTMLDPRQDVAVNAAYNMGVKGFLGFHHALAAMEAGDFSEASAQLLASTWAAQVPNRAKRLAQQMLLGVRIDPAGWKA